MAKLPKAKSATPEAQDTIAFEYIKSQFFRVIHADGALGSITPTGNLHIAFYSERPVIPKMTVHIHNEDGTLGEAISEQTVTRGSIIREMDVDVVIHPGAIDSLIDWLLEQKKTSEQDQEIRKKGAIGRKNRVQH